MERDSLKEYNLYDAIGEEYFDAFKMFIVSLYDTIDSSSEDEREQNGIYSVSNDNGTDLSYCIELDDEELILQRYVLNGEEIYQASYYMNPENEEQDILQFELIFDGKGRMSFKTTYSEVEDVKDMLNAYQDKWYVNGVMGVNSTENIELCK